MLVEVLAVVVLSTVGFGRGYDGRLESTGGHHCDTPSVECVGAHGHVEPVDDGGA